VTPAGLAKKRRKFDPKIFLSTIEGGRTMVAFPKKQTIFAQGDVCDSAFHIHEGKVRLSVVSKSGREATVGILNKGDFFGEGCLTGQPLRMCSATAMSDCTVMRISKRSLMEVIHRERAFSDMFWFFSLDKDFSFSESPLSPLTSALDDERIFARCRLGVLVTAGAAT
jgi:CRP/FNR family transcriptional regulator, cyclic AMP receptor protein